MSYDVLILVLLILIFCVFTMAFTVNVMFSLFNSARPEGMSEIKPISIIKKGKSKPKEKISKQQKADKERFDAIMHNIEVYDGSGRGQIEVE